MQNPLQIKSFGYNAYILLWCLYWLQGTLYTSGGFVSQLILAVLMLVSSYYFICANIKYKLPSVLKTLSIILVLFIVYGMFSIVKGETFTIAEGGVTGITSVGYIKNILISYFPVYTIYVATRRGKFTEQSLQRWVLVFLIVAIVCFFQGQKLALSLSNNDEVTNNAAYSVLAIIILLPLFNKKPVIQYTILIICLCFVIIGMKRGAWICGILATLWLLYDRIRTSFKNKNGLRIVMFSAIVIIVAVQVVNSMINTSDYFTQRIERTLEGNSSHRDEIYLTLFTHFIHETSLVKFLFGNGANATLNISFNYAHNDWLEMAINNGLIMIILYIIFWTQLYSVRNYRNDRVIYMILSLYFVIYLFKSFYSMSYADVPTWSSVALGYSLAISQSYLNSKSKPVLEI